MSLRRVKRSSTICRKSQSDFRLFDDWISTSESGYEDVDDGVSREDIGADLRNIGNKYDKLVLKMFNQRSNVRGDFQLLKKEAKSLRNELKFLIMKHDSATAFKKAYKPESHEVERVVKAEVVTKEIGQLEVALADLMAKYYYLLEQTKTLKDINSLWHIRSVMRSDLLKRGLKIGPDESGAFRSELRSPIVSKDPDEMKSENSLLMQKVRWLNKLSHEFRADLSELVAAKVALLNGKSSLEKQYELTDEINSPLLPSREDYIETLRQTESRIIDGLKKRIAALDRISDALKVAMLKIGFKDLENGLLEDANFANKPVNNNSFKVKQIVRTGSPTGMLDGARRSRADAAYESGKFDDERENEEVQVRYVRAEDVDDKDLQCLSPKSKRRFLAFPYDGAVYGDLRKYPRSASFASDDEKNASRKPLTKNGGFLAENDEFFDVEESCSGSRSSLDKSEEFGVDRSDSDVTLTEEMNIPCMELTDESREMERVDTRKQEGLVIGDTKAHASSKADSCSLSADSKEQRDGTDDGGMRQGDKECFTDGATRQDRFAIAKNYFISYCYSQDTNSGNSGNTSMIKGEDSEDYNGSKDNSETELSGPTFKGDLEVKTYVAATKVEPAVELSSDIGPELVFRDKSREGAKISCSEEHMKEVFVENGEVKRAVSVLPIVILASESKIGPDGDKNQAEISVEEKEEEVKGLGENNGVKRTQSIVDKINLFEGKKVGSGKGIDADTSKLNAAEKGIEHRNSVDNFEPRRPLQTTFQSSNSPKGTMIVDEESNKHGLSKIVATKNDNNKKGEILDEAFRAQSATPSVPTSRKLLSHEDRPVFYDPDGVWKSTPKLRRSKSVCKSVDRRTRDANARSMLVTASQKTTARGSYTSRNFSSSTLPRSLKTSRSPSKNGDSTTAQSVRKRAPSPAQSAGKNGSSASQRMKENASSAAQNKRETASSSAQSSRENASSSAQSIKENASSSIQSSRENASFSAQSPRKNTSPSSQSVRRGSSSNPNTAKESSSSATQRPRENSSSTAQSLRKNSFSSIHNPRKDASLPSTKPRVRPRSTVYNSQYQKEVISSTLPRNMKSRARENPSGRPERPTSRLSRQMNTTLLANVSADSGPKKPVESTASSKVNNVQNNNVFHTLPRGIKLGQRDGKSCVKDAESAGNGSRPASRLRKPAIITEKGGKSPEKRENCLFSQTTETRRDEKIESEIESGGGESNVKEVSNAEVARRKSTENSRQTEEAAKDSPQSPRDSWVIVDTQDAVGASVISEDSEKQSELFMEASGPVKETKQTDAETASCALPRKSKSTSDAPLNIQARNENAFVEPGNTQEKFSTLPRASKAEPLDENLNMLVENEIESNENLRKKKKRKLVIKKRRPNSTVVKNKDSDSKHREDKKHVSKVDLITGKAASWMHSAFRFVSSDNRNATKNSSKGRSVSPVKSVPECSTTSPECIARPDSSASSKRGSMECRKSMIPVPAAF